VLPKNLWVPERLSTLSIAHRFVVGVVVSADKMYTVSLYAVLKEYAGTLIVISVCAHVVVSMRYNLVKGYGKASMTIARVSLANPSSIG
jgi:hypothetical protein